MAGSGGHNTPLKMIQEGAMEIYRTFVPALRRCSSFRTAGGASGWVPGISERRAQRQQSENLKWQQDMFLRLVNMKGLCKEGLISGSDVASFRQKILDNIVVCFDGGEFPQVTRDKLIFLQELLYAGCISDEEYHTVKKSLLYRLAAEGAEINSSDIVLTCSAAPPRSAPTSPLGRKRLAEQPGRDEEIKNTEEPTTTTATRSKASKSPVKHLLEAVSRLKQGGKVHNEATRPRVLHAMDFVKTKECPARVPPEFDISDQCGSPLFHSPSGSVSSMESSSKREHPASAPPAGRYNEEVSPKRTAATRSLFPGLSPRPKSKSPLKPPEKDETQAPEMKVELELEQEEMKGPDAGLKPGPGGSSTPKKPWRLDMLRPPRLVTSRQENNPKAEIKVEKSDSSHDPGVLSPNRASCKAAAPEAMKATKKRFNSKGGSADFFIDKVLGENIKKELEHIRVEMSKTNSTQTFTNDQIDAIATRLPADKSELMRFFPKSWCDRYGDIVLDVVHKEFKGHVKDMGVSRKVSKEKRGGASENDENSGSTTSNNVSGGGKTISKATSMMSSRSGGGMNRCFTTLDENSPRSRARKVTSFNSSSERYEKDLDGKLCAEIEKLPHRTRSTLRV